MVREASLCSWEVLGGAHQVLHLLDQLLDVLARPLELFFMAVQTVPENRVMWLICIDLWVVTWSRDCPASSRWIRGVTTPSWPRSTSHSLKLYPHSLYTHILSETSTLFTFPWQRLSMVSFSVSQIVCLKMHWQLVTCLLVYGLVTCHWGPTSQHLFAAKPVPFTWWGHSGPRVNKKPL